MSEDNPHGRRRPLAVLRHRDYRWLWAGQFVSTFGTQMHAVALSWHVYQLTGSVAHLGLLGLVRAVALMSTSVLGGAVADTRNRRHLMLVTQTLLMIISALVALLTAFDSVSVMVLYAVAMAAAATSAFDGPARQAIIPSLVPRAQLPSALYLNMLTQSVASMAGPAVGGVIIGTVGLAATYALDSASFAAVIIALVVMRTPIQTPVIQARRLAVIIEGWRFIANTPVVLGVMLLDFFATLLSSRVGLAPVFAEDVLHAGPEGLGLLLAAPAAGAVAGGVVLSLLPVARRPGRALVGTIIVYGASLALFGLSTSLWMALLFLAASGAADAVSVAMRHTVRQLATPDALQGRVAAAHSALAMGGPRLGEFQSGMSGALIGPRAAMVMGGTACVFVALIVARQIPQVTRYVLSDPHGPADGAAQATVSAPAMGPSVAGRQQQQHLPEQPVLDRSRPAGD